MDAFSIILSWLFMTCFLLFSVEFMSSKWGLVTDRLLVLFKKFSDILNKGQVFLWTLLELHIIKMVAFYCVWVALEEVSTENNVVEPKSHDLNISCMPDLKLV